MFKKKKTALINNATPEVENEINQPRNIGESGSETIIGTGIKVEGHLYVYGATSIYGEVVGDIKSESGIVNIKNVGTVTGNITCKKLVINGILNGDANADEIEITSQGKVQGSLQYRSLEIVNGGKLSGNIQCTRTESENNESKNNIIDFISEGNWKHY